MGSRCRTTRKKKKVRPGLHPTPSGRLKSQNSHIFPVIMTRHNYTDSRTPGPRCRSVILSPRQTAPMPLLPPPLGVCVPGCFLWPKTVTRAAAAAAASKSDCNEPMESHNPARRHRSLSGWTNRPQPRCAS